MYALSLYTTLESSPLTPTAAVRPAAAATTTAADAQAVRGAATTAAEIWHATPAVDAGTAAAVAAATATASGGQQAKKRGNAQLVPDGIAVEGGVAAAAASPSLGW